MKIVLEIAKESARGTAASLAVAAVAIPASIAIDRTFKSTSNVIKHNKEHTEDSELDHPSGLSWM